MRTTNTFSILFWIYETRAKNDLANIYVRITVNGKKVNLSLKQKVLIQNWNKEKQRAKGKDKVSQIVNQHLDRTHSKLVEIYHELKFQDKYITAELIKATYLGEGDNFKTLQNIIEYHKRKTERFNQGRLKIDLLCNKEMMRECVKCLIFLIVTFCIPII